MVHQCLLTNIKSSQDWFYPSICRISFSEGTDGSECSFTLDGPERKSNVELFVIMSEQDTRDSKREFFCHLSEALTDR